MSHFRSLLFSVSILFLCSVSYAGFYIEPIVGYQLGKVETEMKPTLGGAESKASVTGPAAGLGLGWMFGNISAGLDVETMMLTAKDETTSAKEDWKQTAAHVTVGYNIRPDTRIYLGVGAFMLKDEGTPETTYNGASAKVGAVYQFKNHIAVDAVGILYTPSEMKTAGAATVQTKDVFEKFNYAAVIWNIRFPFGSFGKH
jgi:hypothetical protein